MIILVMGVTGSGKTTIGARLSAEIGWPFFDADDFHTPSSIVKMSSGIPLTDEDRIPWLEELNMLIAEREDLGQNGVLACSALKDSYRRILGAGVDLEVVYLEAELQLVERRLARRKGHYMPQRLIDSQFQALEEPTSALTIPAEWSAERIVQTIRREIGI